MKQLGGIKHHNWTVLSLNRIEKNNRVWLCQCRCGHLKYLRQHDIKSGKKNRCPQCWVSTKGAEHGNWKGVGDISGQRWSQIRRCGERRGISFDISIEEAWTKFESQQGRCALTGVELTIDDNASLDRIDSSHPYVADNIQWVHKIVNQMKWSLSEDEFISWCQLIVEHASVST